MDAANGHRPPDLTPGAGHTGAPGGAPEGAPADRDAAGLPEASTDIASGAGNEDRADGPADAPAEPAPGAAAEEPGEAPEERPADALAKATDDAADPEETGVQEAAPEPDFAPEPEAAREPAPAPAPPPPDIAARTGPATLEALRADPRRFHLFLALRLLEAAHPDRPRLGESRRPRQDAVRIGQSPEMAFAPTTVDALRMEGGRAHLSQRAFGLFGPHGPLPSHLTEYVRERLRVSRDPTPLAFADMLTHRMASLFVRAWRTGRPAASFDRGRGGGMEAHVAALAGVHGRHLTDRDAMPDLAKRFFAGRLSAGPRNAEGLRAILSAFLAAPVRIEEFVGAWLPLEPSDRFRLGAPATLGGTAVIGERVWSRGARFRVVVGPLDLAGYRRLLPGGASLARLAAAVRGYAGDALDWDVNLVLRAEEVPPARLGTRDAILGQLAFMGGGTGRDRNDMLAAPPRASGHTEGDAR